MMQIEKIADGARLRNAKSKRSRNLIKKCMELSKMCGLKINLVLFDEHTNRMQEYSSDTQFDVQKVLEM